LPFVFLAAAAAQYMNMIAALGAFKQTGNQIIVRAQVIPADRAAPGRIPVKAIITAPDMHKPVLPAGKRGICTGTDQFPLVQYCGTNRANLGIAGPAAFTGLLLSGLALPSETYTRKLSGKQGIAKTKQRNPNDNDSQYL